ncbi:MAG: peptidase [Rickettsiales bacterium]|nr:peptidase [Rickettsiales bacterium]
MSARRFLKVSLVVLLITSGIILMRPAPASSNEDTLRMLDLFGDVFEKVRSDYVEEVSDVDLIENAINGMLTSLDPHSSYLNKKAFNEMRIQTRGEFGGLGIEVTMENGLVKVVSPIDDTPAYVAGVKAGDMISEIDGEQVMGLTLAEAVEKMRGKKGSKILITVLREGAKEPLKFTIVRDVIRIRSVRARKEKDIGYIRITSFSEQTAEGLDKAIKTFKKEMGTGLKGIVLDLRNNPGGLLDQAVEVADSFLDQGEIVSTRGRMEGSIKRFPAKKGDITGNVPVVVLINSGSASASEIVAGALQDHKRAIIMGTKSFGKGSVQTVIPVPGEGAIRLTTSRYYTPSGRSIQAEGIVPDIEVKPAKIELLDNAAAGSYTEASLRGHLDNGNKKSDEAKPTTPAATPASTPPATDPVTGEATDGSLYDQDYQLARAIDLLRGLSLFKK